MPQAFWFKPLDELAPRPGVRSRGALVVAWLFEGLWAGPGRCRTARRLLFGRGLLLRGLHCTLALTSSTCQRLLHILLVSFVPVVAPTSVAVDHQALRRRLSGYREGRA